MTPTASIEIPIVGSKNHGMVGVTVVFLIKGAMMTYINDDIHNIVAMDQVLKVVLSFRQVEALLKVGCKRP